VGRPPTGQDPTVTFRIPATLRDELDAIAAREGTTRTALLVRLVRRYVENYPLDEVD
jgi:metal-responsive CopG/Arc/MetJ family transcriptional regulator